MREIEFIIKSNQKLADNIYKMSLYSEEGAGKIQCGQFINVSINSSEMLLKRPFGLFSYDEYGKNVSFCYQVVGKGTSFLSKMTVGQKVSATIPLGNGFCLNESHKKVALIGGGVGVFPLHSVSINYKEKEFYSYLGFRSSCNSCVLDEFNGFSKTHIATDDGTLGETGNAVDLFFDNVTDNKPDIILACGPSVMLESLKVKLEEKKLNIPTYVSLEERMGCGIGACLVCACKVIGNNGVIENKRVCKDGPVFNILEVEL